MKVWQWGLWWLWVIALTVVATIGLSFPLFLGFAASMGTQGDGGYTMGTLASNYGQLLHYLMVPWHQPLLMSDFPTSASGAHHFLEVKRLFVLAEAVLIALTPWWAHTHKRLRTQRKRYLMVRGINIGMWVPLGIGALAATNFNAAFVAFHHLLFRNSDWLFDPATDPIITVLPEAFFAACAGLALLIFEGLLLTYRHRFRKDA